MCSENRIVTEQVGAACPCTGGVDGTLYATHIHSTCKNHTSPPTYARRQNIAQ